LSHLHWYKKSQALQFNTPVVVETDSTHSSILFELGGRDYLALESFSLRAKSQLSRDSHDPLYARGAREDSTHNCSSELGVF
jgi:hypothetical protein